GVTMLMPMSADITFGHGHRPVFLESASLTTATGGVVALASGSANTTRLSIRPTFLLASGVWVVMPLLGAIPFALGATDARAVDAYFEAMSGVTTTGSTVFVGLEALPAGLLLWRSMLQWFGGIGIIVVAMVFLQELKV